MDRRLGALSRVGHEVADLKSATGSLTVFLVLTSYVLVSATIFLVGAELDELARKRNRGS